MSIDAVVGGALMEKSMEATRALLEEMTSNNYHWFSESARLKRNGGKYRVDVVNFLTIKVDALV